jgi:GNAT superfamily N-acetyltransferase
VSDDVSVAPVRLVDLDPGDPRLLTDVLPVLRELRPHLTPESFTAVYDEGHGQGLRFLAAYLGDECVGVAGWRIVVTTSHLRKLYVDDLVTTEARRSAGVGRALLDGLGERAQADGCHVLDLDSNVQRIDAHRFYEREGLAITAYHFTRSPD